MLIKQPTRLKEMKEIGNRITVLFDLMEDGENFINLLKRKVR